MTRQATEPSQPNLDVSGGEQGWPARFWVMTSLTGAVAGVAGGVLMRLLGVVERLSWDYRTGTLLEAAARASPWRHVLVLALAGLVVGAGVAALRRAFGSSEDVDAAIWFRSGRVALLPTLARAAHTIVTVGMGVSLGRESPIKQAGAAFGCLLARWGQTSRAEQRALVACGVGAGMAAAYNVPIGGALFAAEVLLGSVALRLALPALLCSCVATLTSWALLPTGPIYVVPEYPISAGLTAWSVAVGPAMGLLTVGLVRAIGWAEARRPRGGAAALIAPAVTMTLLGAASIAFPQLLGNGKDAVQLAYSDAVPLSLLLVLPGLKLLATTACLGSGASGGLFTPTMTIGALLGGLSGRAWNRAGAALSIGAWAGMPVGSCAVIGSCAFLAAASQGPISSIVIVLELTRHVDGTMVPMLLAVAGAMLVARRIESRSIYSIRIGPGSPLAQFEAAAPFGAAIPPRPCRTISAAAGYAQVAGRLLGGPSSAASDDPIYVLDDRGRLVGMIGRASLAGADVGGMPLDAAKAADLATPIAPLTTGMLEAEALARLAESGHGGLPVVDAATGRFMGAVGAVVAVGAGVPGVPVVRDGARGSG